MPNDAQSNDAKISGHLVDERHVFTLEGEWTTNLAVQCQQLLESIELESARDVVLDVSQISRLDTAGAWLIGRFCERNDEPERKFEIAGQSLKTKVLFKAVNGKNIEFRAADSGKSNWVVINLIEGLGRTVMEFYYQFILAMHILGATIRGGQLKAGRKRSIFFSAIAMQIERTGVGALPVVVLMSFIVGAIIAQQGAFNLRYFGAEIFVVNLVSILVLREMGVLLTAIMVAGRSGSAITAEIGTMKMREEVDALTVMGLNPIAVLVLPRMIAMVISLPCLTIAADAAALLGAMTTTYFYSNIPIEAFIERMSQSVDMSTIISGLLKAPFMAIIIGIVAAMEGFRVSGSADSLGRQVTASVVKSIFFVIVLDGFFAMFYAAIGY